MPEHSTEIAELLSNNINHRNYVEKYIEDLSLMIEKATVQLIEMFIDLVHIEPVDRHGDRLFRLPRNEINDDNWKKEFQYPIDKYDWLIFEKIFQQVFQYPESKRSLCTIIMHNLDETLEYYSFNIFFLIVFANYEHIEYGIDELHKDCRNLFSYFNSEILDAMVTNVVKSLQHLKQTFFNPK